MGYKPKVCAICGQSYEPQSGKSKYCRNCAPSWSDKKAYDKWYREHFSDEVALAKAEAYQKRKSHYREVSSRNRLLRRREIQDQWGRVGGERGTWNNLSWVKAEEIAVKILQKEGYHNVVRLDYFRAFPFDIRADKGDNFVFVFQVTMRTHEDRMKNHLRLANDLGLSWQILYVRPALDKYIIKSSGQPGAEELNLADMKNLKEVVV